MQTESGCNKKKVKVTEHAADWDDLAWSSLHRGINGAPRHRTGRQCDYYYLLLSRSKTPFKSIAIAITIRTSRALLDHALHCDHLGWSQPDAIPRSANRGHDLYRYRCDYTGFDPKADRKIDEIEGAFS